LYTGWLNTTRIHIIPEELNVSFRLATGLRDEDDDEWADFCGMFARAGRAVKLDTHATYSGKIFSEMLGLYGIHEE